MPFRELGVNVRTANRLNAMSRHGDFSHAYAFSGSEALAFEAAREFVKAAYCVGSSERPCGECLPCRKIAHGNHEDVIYVTADGGSIKVAHIEELQSKLRNKPFSASRVAAIIREADKMTPQSQNKLLKTLEEPAPGYIIALATENHERLLKTILSRCVLVKVEPEARQTDGETDAKAAALIEMIGNARPYIEITKQLESAAPDKESSLALLEALERAVHALALSHARAGGGAEGGKADGEEASKRSGGAAANVKLAKAAPKLVSLIEETSRDLSYNVSNKYAMRNLVLRVVDLLEAGG
ncbi:MAG: hypothetical protein LBG71_02655 [Clostridiales Family XIII bacterium]|jgi:DNA polymerase-3 subunit delta'|nr:hypothetical protein [Clostridiales Family XIII bacterium]